MTFSRQLAKSNWNSIENMINAKIGWKLFLTFVVSVESGRENQEKPPSETRSSKGPPGIALLSIEHSPEQSTLDVGEYLLPVNERSTYGTPARAESLDAGQAHESAHVYEEIDAAQIFRLFASHFVPA